MAFGGYCGFNVDLNKIKDTSSENIIDLLFAEECGWVLEVDAKNVDEVLLEISVPVYVIGHTSTYGNKSRVCCYWNILFCIVNLKYIILLIVFLYNY